MKTTHTPGPWEVMGNADVYSSDGTLIFHSPTTRPFAECQRNARLIAAAPELLEMVKTMDCLCTGKEIKKICVLCRTIAKAEGK